MRPVLSLRGTGALALLLIAAAFGGCDRYHGVSEQELVGNYRFVAEDAGASHAPESLVITTTLACTTPAGPAAKTSCLPWRVLRGREQDMFLTDDHSYIIARGRKIRLIVDPDLYWFFDKVS
jgi:hypothetical protein